MNLSISEAAELVGIDRKTLYKHIAKGRVSAGLDANGQKVIQAAELHRAYGDFTPPATPAATTGDTQRRQLATPTGDNRRHLPATTGDTQRRQSATPTGDNWRHLPETTDTILMELVKEVKALREENRQQADQLAAIRDELAERSRLDRLEHNPSKRPVPHWNEKAIVRRIMAKTGGAGN